MCKSVMLVLVVAGLLTACNDKPKDERPEAFGAGCRVGMVELMTKLDLEPNIEAVDQFCDVATADYIATQDATKH